MKDPQLARKEAEQMIIEKAMKDKQFRDQLIRNTKETLEKNYGKKLPDACTLTVVEEKPGIFYLVLPTLPAAGMEHELSASELENVAGGAQAPDQLDWCTNPFTFAI